MPHVAGIPNYSYEYDYKDNTDSTVLSFSDLNKDGVIDKNNEVIQQTSYYPFGLDFAGQSTVQIGVFNRFKFGGKELQNELGLNLYDFEKRWYSPVLGVFTGAEFGGRTFMEISSMEPFLFVDSKLRFV